MKICDFGLSRVIGYERPRGSSSADATSALTPDTADTTVVGGEAAVPSENTLPRPLKRELTRHVVTRCMYLNNQIIVFLFLRCIIK